MRRRLAPFALALIIAGCAGESAKPATRHGEGRTCFPGTLGIEVTNVSSKMHAAQKLPPDLPGALIIEVLPGSPAAHAGLAAGDIILTLDGEPVGTQCDATGAIFSHGCSDTVGLTYRRAGHNVTLSVPLVEALRFYDASCKAGQMTACARLGWLFENGSRVPKDEEQAATLFDRACRAGSPIGCSRLGYFRLDHDAPAEALPLLKTACDGDDSAACAGVAFLYATGKGVPQNDDVALPLYQRSCDLGDPAGCYNVGEMVGYGRGAPRDDARAVAAYREGCEGGSSSACTNLGYFIEHGRGAPADPKQGVELYRRGCKPTTCSVSNALGCVNLGRAYMDGIGVAKDGKEAARIFGEMCERPPDPDDTDAAPNISRACSLLGALYSEGNGVKADPARAVELTRRGCDQGDSFGCFNMGIFYKVGQGVDKDPAQSADFFNRACTASDAEGCYQLGLFYETGQGVGGIDRRRAHTLFAQACKGGYQEACGK